MMPYTNGSTTRSSAAAAHPKRVPLDLKIDVGRQLGQRPAAVGQVLRHRLQRRLWVPAELHHLRSVGYQAVEFLRFKGS